MEALGLSVSATGHPKDARIGCAVPDRLGSPGNPSQLLTSPVDIPCDVVDPANALQPSTPGSIATTDSFVLKPLGFNSGILRAERYIV